MNSHTGSDDLILRHDLRPGDLGRVTELHGKMTRRK